MYKVKDCAGTDHIVDANDYEYDNGFSGVVNFWKDKEKVASFDRPMCIEKSS
jgi:hypothetical protein